MKLSTYIESLEDALKKYGDLEVIYSSDEEGNSFDKINFSPTIGHFFSEDREWISEDSILDDDLEYEINSVCVN
jgi:hypothetical protein